MLLGFARHQKDSRPSHLSARIEGALVAAANLALNQSIKEQPLSRPCIVFVLNHTFEWLADSRRAQLQYDLLLPSLVDTTFSSGEGLEDGYWLGMIDADVVELTGKRFNWSATSNTFAKVREIHSRPLMASLGPLSRLIAHAVDSVRDVALIPATLDRLADFARRLMVSWRQNKLSEVEQTEELDSLDLESTKTTLPTLWQLLRLCLFAIVIILRAVLGRLLADSALSSGTTAPSVSIQCLHALRNLYFISNRLGQTSSSQYIFVNLTAIDVLAQYPDRAENFLRSVKPSQAGQIPPHPLDRCLDLFFLNTAEHFTLILPLRSNEELLMASTLPYLATSRDKRILQIFEAAHSLALAVLSSTQGAEVTERYFPFYVGALFQAFPDSLSARQFRLAFQTVIQIAASPSPPAPSQPTLLPVLLDLVHHRALNASPTVLPQHSLSNDRNPVAGELALSEQAVLVMALVDSLRHLPVTILEEWLPLVAGLVDNVDNQEMKQACHDRLWAALSAGGMDVERAVVCAAWWNSKGEREKIITGEDAIDTESYLMSGALLEQAKL